MAVWNPRANEILANALELPGPQRGAYLDQACAADSELRRQVEALLAAHAAAGNFLDQPAHGAVLAGATTPPPDSGPPLPAGASVVRALGNSRPCVQLREPEGETAPGAGTAAAAAGPAEVPPRYRVEGEIARGGMGAILKGRDTDLGRDIAVKVLLETHQGRTELVQRFVEEAQIAGQLQHPGIVPVYDLEAVPGKRPYFTMKLVKGQTLAKLLQRRQQPGEELPRFVGIFEQVCQTLAYAHARGVIHRDLKPANVMVGAFGEVQVMDWGLAKVLSRDPGQPAREASSIIQTLPAPAGPGDGSGRTQLGTALGTPAYMAPEQARGEVEEVDERADVFGLGAILCEILTGKPAFPGTTSAALGQAQRGDVAEAFARLDGCGADAALIGLAKRCLASQPGARPVHAGAVAEAVTAYQRSVGDRLRQAEMERAQAQVKAAEERKRRKLAVGLAAAILALVVGAAGGGLWLQRQHAERQAEQARQQVERRQAVAAALEKAAGLQKEARWAEARAVLEQTQQRLGEADEADLRSRVRQALADLNLVGELDTIRVEASAVVDGKRDYAGADRKYAAAFRAAGLGEAGDDPREVAARVARSSIRAVLVAALDDWAARSPERSRREWALAVAGLADPEPGHERFRAANGRGDRAALEKLALAARKEGLSPQLLYGLAQALARSGGNPVPLLRSAQERHPDDFWLNFELGTLLDRARQEEGVGYLRAALALRPGNSTVCNNLGIALESRGQLDEAIACFRKAVALSPGYANAYNSLGAALSNKGKVDEAIACVQRAIELNPNSAVAHSNLGGALRDKGRLDEAIAECRTALALKPNFAHAHSNLGNALQGKGRLDEAIEEHRKAIALEPDDAVAHSDLGNALRAKGRLDEAIEACRKAIDLKPDLARAHNNLGSALKDKGKVDESIACYRKAIKLEPHLAKAHNNLGAALADKGWLDEAIEEYRKALELKPDYALAHNNLGNALQRKDRLDEAIEEYRKALELKLDDAMAHYNLGLALKDKGRLDEAIAEWRKAIKLEPDLAMAHTNLGNALADKGRPDEAIACYRKAIKLAPKEAPAHSNLGLALFNKGQVDEAIGCYKKALKLDPGYAKAHSNLGFALSNKGKVDEAIAHLRRAIELDPKDFVAYCRLGLVWQNKGHVDKAIDCYQKALQRMPSGHRLRPLLSQQLRQCQRGLALEKKLPDILSGRLPASAAQRIDYALHCAMTGRHRASARLYGEAFKADAGLADNLQTPNRYNAACSAAQAGCGQGADAGQLDDKERSGLRKQALDWLRADLAAWARQAASDEEADRARVRQTLGHWQSDTDLAGVRAPEALAKLPQKERVDWQKLWADLEALLLKSQQEAN
jgi:tetratricopeptide (TPR) repeat protein